MRMNARHRLLAILLAAAWPAGAAAAAAGLRQCLGAHCRHGPALRAALAGPEHRGRLCRPAGPGLCGLLRHRRLYVRPAGLAAPERQLPGPCRHVPAWPAHAAVAGDSAGGAAGRRAGGAAGCAHLATARRLPGHRDAGLWRDHPRLPEQPGPAGQPHQRAQGHRPDRLAQVLRPRPRQEAQRLRLRPVVGHALLLPVPGCWWW